MKGYKAFDKDLKCRDFQYEIGGVYKHDGEIKPCGAGFHFCKQLKDVYSYYPKNYDTRICEVEATGLTKVEGDKTVTDEIKIIRELSKDEVKNLTDDLKFNSGDYNSGDYNSGDYNSGNRNSGNRNSGYYNSGNYNSGYYNSGDYNSGHYNSGNHNSGHYNSGDYNSGNYNSGNHNSGDYNSGHYNSGDYNSGYFNTTTPKVRLFNRDTDIEYKSETISKLNSVMYELRNDKLLLTWVSESKMSDQEKTDNPSYKTTGGYLKKSENHKYLDQSKLTQEHVTFLTSLPNFDAKIFQECTGLDVTVFEKITIEIGGKTLELTNTELENLKKQLETK